MPIPIEVWRPVAALDARSDGAIERHDANRPSHMHRSHFNFDWIRQIRIGSRNRLPRLAL